MTSQFPANASVYWDMTASVNAKLGGFSAARAIRSLVAPLGCIQTFKYYVDYAHPAAPTPALASELQCSGVTVVETASRGRPNASSKMMIADCFAQAIAFPAPQTLVLITADPDLLYTAALLRAQNYEVVLFCPGGADELLVSEANWVDTENQVLSCAFDFGSVQQAPSLPVDHKDRVGTDGHENNASSGRRSHRRAVSTNTAANLDTPTCASDPLPPVDGPLHGVSEPISSRPVELAAKESPTPIESQGEHGTSFTFEQLRPSSSPPTVNLPPMRPSSAPIISDSLSDAVSETVVASGLGGATLGDSGAAKLHAKVSPEHQPPVEWDAGNGVGIPGWSVPLANGLSFMVPDLESESLSSAVSGSPHTTSTPANPHLHQSGPSDQDDWRTRPGSSTPVSLPIAHGFDLLIDLLRSRAPSFSVPRGRLHGELLKLDPHFYVNVGLGGVPQPLVKFIEYAYGAGVIVAKAGPLVILTYRWR